MVVDARPRSIEPGSALSARRAGVRDHALCAEVLSRLEEHFVVVHWDQRGADNSSEVSPESLRLEQYLSDTLEVVEWLRHRFGIEKIYLLGHSWGSVLGVLTVQRHPDLFYAYIGLGQVVDQRRGEDRSYRFVVDRAQAEGNDEALEQLRGRQPPYRNVDQLIRQRIWLGHYGGTFHTGDGILKVVSTILTSSEYSLRDKAAYYGCFVNSTERAWFDLEGIDFIRSVGRLDVPVYFFTGRHDHTTPAELVVEWAEVLEAPHVEVVWFEHSAHMACLEEPERFQDELINRVLAAGTNTPHR